MNSCTSFTRPILGKDCTVGIGGKSMVPNECCRSWPKSWPSEDRSLDYIILYHCSAMLRVSPAFSPQEPET